jgi:hypothetical protein
MGRYWTRIDHDVSAHGQLGTFFLAIFLNRLFDKLFIYEIAEELLALEDPFRLGLLQVGGTKLLTYQLATTFAFELRSLLCGVFTVLLRL